MIQGKIKNLKEIVIQQANNIEKMLNNCFTGLINKDKEMLKKIIEIEEIKINKNEIKIDELLTGIFALYKPEAKDLRTVLMIVKMNIDLERIGDHCVNIAESALYLVERPLIKQVNKISTIFEITKKMIKESIDSFLNGNIDNALLVCKMDEEVDKMNEIFFKELVTEMSSDPSYIEIFLHTLRIVNNLEKIADLATNICEEAIYTESGKVIKHHKFEKK